MNASHRLLTAQEIAVVVGVHPDTVRPWWRLGRLPPRGIRPLASVLADAQVDLNPYQVEAALFAFRSPFSKGAILADEVGLGKTIEAGLLLAQRGEIIDRPMLPTASPRPRDSTY